ncbi:DUF2065 family protein [Hyphomonas sp.]|uniref:DUF2065 family protein n=1 Tax=Hyphomonas sp. TaxID=87 RepID=UPI00391B9988
MEIGTLILAGLGLWLLIEGGVCALAPDFVRRITEMISGLPARELSLAGAMAAVIGAGLVWLAVRTA